MGSRGVLGGSDAGTSRPAVFEVELNQLEDIILGKIQQRVPSRVSEDNYLVKQFKYHDLNTTGLADFQRFQRVISPFATGLIEQDLNHIFDRYAANGSLNYKVFASEFVRGNRRLGCQPGRLEPNDQMPLGSEAGCQQPMEHPEETFQRMKAYMANEGPRCIMALLRSFQECDPDNIRVVDQEDFFNILQRNFPADSSCALQDEVVYNMFDMLLQPSTPGLIAYDEFLQVLKDDPMNQDRREAVRAAFRRLDENSEGLVNWAKMLKAFSATRHPQVSDGSIQADDAVQEFTETIDECVAFRRGQQCYPSNLIAWEEFEDYYKFVSCCYESDAYFCTVLQRVWNLDKDPKSAIEARKALAKPAAGIPGKSRAGLHHWQKDTLPTHLARTMGPQSASIHQVLDNVRAAIASKGIIGAVEVVRHFYTADDDVDDLLDEHEFRKACRESGILLPEREEEACFQLCGQTTEDGDTKINLQRFLRALHGPLSEKRLDLIKDVFKVLGGDPDDETSTLNPAALKHHYAAEGHPLVLKGEMEAIALLGEFLDSFSLLAHILGGCQSGAIAFSDFLAYYDLVSSTIASDALFELLMHRLWPIEDGEEKNVGETEVAVTNGQDGPSPSKRWAVPVHKTLENPVARQRPPVHDGPGAYARADCVDSPDAHRRFAKGYPQTTTNAPITKSQIKFQDIETGEFGFAMKRLRTSIAKRGLKGWRTLADRFSQSDYRRNGAIMRLDWQRVQKNMGLGLSPEDQELIFKMFAKTRRDGAMNYRDCLQQLRGQLSNRRVSQVKALWEHLEEESQDGKVTIDGIKSKFDPMGAPLCVIGAKDVASEKRDFDDAVDFFCSSNFNEEVFMDFFAMVSSIYEEEDEFKLFVTAAFNV